MAELRCYMIVLAELTDRERFLAGYARVVPDLVSRFGGPHSLRQSRLTRQLCNLRHLHVTPVASGQRSDP
jgi:hypothetical protein